MASGDDHPYRAEYAKSNRASCKGCSEGIAQGELRLAVMVQSSKFDGKIPYWFHSSCFFNKHKPKAFGDIAKVDGLRYEDQTFIKGKLGMSSSANGSAGTTAEKKGKGSKKAAATKRPKASSSKSKGDFKIEYAASSRAVCIGCEQKIIKEEIRCAKMDYESEKAVRFGAIPRWYHLTCFKECRPDTEFWDSGDTLPGYAGLKADDKKTVKDTLPKMEPVKKEEPEEDGSPAKKMKVDDAAYAKQSKALYALRDNLEQLSLPNLRSLLEHNDLSVPAGKERVLDALIDNMLFGALETCPECKEGKLYYRNSLYHCDGQTEWSKCDYTTNDPARKKFKVPKSLQEKNEFLSSFKGKVSKRLIMELERSGQSSHNVLPSLTKSGGIKVNRPKPPLNRMQFAIHGNLTKSLDELKKDLIRLGAKVVQKVDEQTMAVISEKKSVEKNTAKKITDADVYGVHVVPEEFVEEAKLLTTNDEVVALVKKLAISSWGNDPKDRLPAEEDDSEKSQGKSMYMSASGSSKVKVQLKNGAYVDPESGLEKKAHVLKSGGDLYTAVLSKSDVQKGYNSYYKIQVIESDNKNKWWVFRAWGRIGTTIGNKKLENFDDPDDAVDAFNEVFEKQTGNEWRKRKNFKKQPGLYYLMDIDYGDNQKDQLVSLENSALKSGLPAPVQDLMKLMFDVKAMEQTMLEFEIDLEKMPLGKLSSNQIREAFSELSKLQDMAHGNEKPNKSLITAATNRFYTLIPHCVGTQSLPLLDSESIIKSKLDMLESLLDMEVAYKMLKSEEGSSSDEKGHPLDSQYAKLKTTITVLDRNSEEFGHLQTYVRNTHAETHQQYELDILEVFKVERHGEEKRYKPFKKLPNRKLLWHGSRVTNYPGILSQGLRIAPPEAPVTGYMFGKGIYFADMVSKSANYCFTTKKNSTGLMLLCEVALGEMVERTQADFIEKLPKGKHSVKGVGATHPHPEHSVKLPHGVEIPLGPPAKNTVANSTLLYNEYIVYDVSQVKIEYLLKMNFKFKY